MPLYFIAIVAPPEVNAQALAWKNYMLESFECKVALRSPAHITLIPPFGLAPDKVELLGEALTNFVSQQNTFEIRLRNFGAFAPRVIYIDVEPSERLELVRAELEKFLLEESYPIKRDTRTFHPHVTIANRDLDKKDFAKAWNYFKEIKYEADFKAAGISLLINASEGWRVLKSFTFNR